MERKTPRAIRYLLWIVVATCSLLALTFMCYLIIWGINNPNVSQLIEDQYIAVIGVPLCCIVAFILVSVLKIGEGPIELKAFGFEFKGAAGPVILWVFSFLALVTGTKLLLLP